MFTISLIITSITVMLLAAMAYFGVLQYKETTDDDDADKTVSDLKKLLLALVVVIIASLGIMGYSHYTEKPNAQSIQIEAK